MEYRHKTCGERTWEIHYIIQDIEVLLFLSAPQSWLPLEYLKQTPTPLKIRPCKVFIANTFCSHKWFKGCTVVPYHRPALHPCLPLHLPALLCLQALCPVHPPHHPPHMELEYIQILREKKKKKRNTTQWKSSVLNCTNSLYWRCLSITVKTRNPEICHLERHLQWSDTSRVQQIKECLPLGSLTPCSESCQGFSEQQALWKIKREGNWEDIKPE